MCGVFKKRRSEVLGFSLKVEGECHCRPHRKAEVLAGAVSAAVEGTHVPRAATAALSASPIARGLRHHVNRASSRLIFSSLQQIGKDRGSRLAL